MEIPKTYSPAKTEDKWYAEWLAKGFFKSKPDRRPAYTIVMPPPNVTGVLHMGHMLNNTIQDVLVRRARMQGYNACWLPGTDHASIATEAKVVNKLQEEGIDINSISREEFLNHAWQWTNKHKNIILEQLKRLGASCDWDRARFTMEPSLSEAVTKVFIELYNKELIYRGVRMINWDPMAMTALSNEEVIYKEVNSKLYYIRYKIDDESDNYILIATTRPETILGDTAICVHPNDPRYKQLIGKHAIVPIVNRSIPIIMDEYVDMEFGTGALKITPAHDIHDYELGHKHHLEIIDILNDDGTLNENATCYIGEDRFAVREKIENDLNNAGHLDHIEDILNKVGCSERTGAVIEPRLSTQWFCKMSELAKPALDNVLNNKIKFHPAKFKNTYRHWMENIQDWCISRQLRWGHRIPVWYCDNKGCDDVLLVRKTVPDKCPKCNSTGHLRQDEDVLDTWFSSWLWPISVFDGFEEKDNKDIEYYYPTSDLVTAPEIIFFWVARMIMAGYAFRNEKPFSNVYFTGLVRDKLKRKMSKSLGNSPEPLELIARYGADGVRVGMLLCSPAGNDLLFKSGLCEQGRNFCNKLWNAFRLINMWQADENIKQSKINSIAVQWFKVRLAKSIDEIDKLYSEFKISEVLMNCYRLIWDEFCPWYLEMIKPKAISDDPAKTSKLDVATYKETVAIFESLLKLLHPFMPFITEEIWHLLKHRSEDDFITISSWPAVEKYNHTIIEDFENTKTIISNIRNFRTKNNIPHKKELTLYVKKHEKKEAQFNDFLIKLCSISQIKHIDENIEGAYSFIVNSNEYFLLPQQQIDTKAQLLKLNDELLYYQGFYKALTAKLENKNFTANAPKNIIEREIKKQQDALKRTEILKEQIEVIKNNSPSDH